MIMWLLGIAILFVCYFISENTKNPRKTFFVTAGILLVLLWGSRYFINNFTDEITYNYLYQGYSDTSFSAFIDDRSGERDFGFYLFYWCMANVIPWPQFPIYFITAAFITVTFRFAYKNTEGTLIPALLMFSFGIFSFYMAAYRQCFAMCVCLTAFEFAKKRGIRGIIPYALLMTVAVYMHISAIIFIPVYFILRIKRNAGGNIAWILSAVVVMLAASAIMTFASEWLEEDGLLDRLEFSATGLVIQIALMATPILLHIFSVSDYGRLAGVQHVLLILTSVGLLFLSFKFMYYTYERVSYYYSFFVIGALSNALTGIKERRGEFNYKFPVLIVAALLLVALAYIRMPTNTRFFFEV